MRGALMVCGAGSDVGKSQIVAGLCRLLARRGVRVAPFKPQNIAQNTFVTPDGHEIGRAQAMQAMAAGVEPEVSMNPVLVKPAVGDRAGQLVVMGRPWSTPGAAAYRQAVPELRDIVDAALEDLRSRFDVVLCEGVGAAAELNQADADIVNLGLAARAGIPAVVVGDVERGGVVAALYGTVLLLPDEQRRWVRGFVVNKLRGDPSLVTEDAAELERRCGIPTLGIIPFAEGLSIDTEDAMALARGGPGTVLDQGATGEPADPSPDGRDRLDVAVVRLPHISGFTDVDALGVEPDVSVRFVDQVSSLGEPDLIVLPGTKATVADLEWFRAEGYERALSDLRAGDDGPFVLGICGGYQMLGGRIDDPGGVESSSGTVNGLGLLDLRTVFLVDRRTRQRRGRTNWRQVPLSSDAGRLPDSELEGAPRQSPSLTVTGYEIHHGRTYPGEGTTPWLLLGDGRGRRGEGIVDDDAGIVGSNLHGLLENDDLRSTLLGAVAARRHKRWVPSGVSFATAREGQIDRLADLCRQHLDTTALWQLIVEGGGTQQRPEAATRT